MKMQGTLYYPGGFHLKEKRLELTYIELMAMCMSNKVLSEGRCFEIESKVFYLTEKGEKKLRIILGGYY